MRYISKITTLADDSANNALYVGTLMHEAIEEGIDVAAERYYKRYPVITDEQINEVVKVEYMAPLVRQLLGKGAFEVKLQTDDFIGYIDYVEVLPDGTFALYDFKYSNNVSNYETSAQIHLYKYFFERVTGQKVSKIAYVMIPKVSLKWEYGEPVQLYRQRLKRELRKKEPFIHNVRYSVNKVIQWLLDTKRMLEATEWPKQESNFCYFCEYRKYCEEGIDYMLLPENKRRDISKITKKKIWIYGAPFSGKTFLANKFPDPLMLNTDGNITLVDAPVQPIKDEVMVEGRITKTKLAWEVFKEVIFELEKKQNTFKTIVVDLLEDLYQSCRVYICQQMGISHESDDNFRAWDKVTSEFLNTLKRLMVLDYENIILISHEDMSKDITKKSGDKITSIRPNLREKVANKVAGMVDIVARVLVDDEKGRIINIKASDVVFGGGRLPVNVDEIPNDYNALMGIYEEANKNVSPVIDTPETNATIQRLKEEAQAERVEKVVQEESEPIEIGPMWTTQDEPKEPMTVETVEPQPATAPEPVQGVQPGVRRRRRRVEE